jgi:hypothetical protein
MPCRDSERAALWVEIRGSETPHSRKVVGADGGPLE